MEFGDPGPAKRFKISAAVQGPIKLGTRQLRSDSLRACLLSPLRRARPRQARDPSERLASSLTLFACISAHLVNRALGLSRSRPPNPRSNLRSSSGKPVRDSAAVRRVRNPFRARALVGLRAALPQNQRRGSIRLQHLHQPGLATSERILPSGQPGPRPTWPPCGLTHASFGVLERMRDGDDEMRRPRCITPGNGPQLAGRISIEHFFKLIEF